MNAPKLRFKGFNDQWSPNQLDNLVIFYNKQRKPVKESDRISGEYPYYGASGIVGYVNNFIFEGEYLLLSEDGANIVSRNLPIVYRTKDKFWVNNHAHIFKSIDSVVQNYLYHYLEKINYVPFNSGTAQPKLNLEAVKLIPVNLPSYKEQEKLATFFERITKKIQLQQEKMDLLKEQKKGYMQKIFTQGLRFKNNAGQDFPEWRKSHLHQLVEQVKGNSFKSVENIDIPVLTISAKVGFVNQKDRFSEVIAGNSLAKYTELQKFDLSYNKGNSKTAKYGCVFVQGNYDQALVPNVYKSFRAKPHVNPYFLQYLFSTGLLDKQLKGIISSTARMDGLLNVSDQDFYNLSIHCPSLEEQDKISNFLKLLDQKIEQCENYKKNLEMQKQYFMQQMFI